MGVSKNTNFASIRLAYCLLNPFVTTLCYSQKMFPYISNICCVTIFRSRLVLFKDLNF